MVVFTPKRRGRLWWYLCLTVKGTGITEDARGVKFGFGVTKISDSKIMLFLHFTSFFSWVSLILVYSVPFLLSSSLGAGSGKWTRKPLGAHQEKFDGCNRREHGCLRFRDQSTFPVLEICHHENLYIDCIVSSFALFVTLFASLLSFVSSCYFTLQDKKNFFFLP